VIDSAGTASLLDTFLRLSLIEGFTVDHLQRLRASGAGGFSLFSELSLGVHRGDPYVKFIERGGASIECEIEMRVNYLL